MAKQIVYMPIEIKQRELYAQMMLAYLLCQKGFRVVIGYKQTVEGMALAAKEPGIFWYKDVSLVKADLFHKLRSKGFYIIATDAEGLVMWSKERYQNTRLSQKTMDCCNQIFTWGKEHSAAILDKYPQYSNRIVRVGDPRIDLIYDTKTLFADEIKSIKQKYGDFIFIISSKFAAKYRGEGMQKKLAMMCQHSERKDQEFIDKIMHDTMIQEKLAMNFEEAIHYVAQNTSKTIVIRPHPGEKKEVFKRVFIREKNIVIDDEYEIAPWLYSADVIVHTNSTAAVEASLMNKSTVLYCPENLELNKSGLIQSVSKRVYNKEELLQSIKDSTNQSSMKPPILAQYIESDEKRTSCDMIIDEMMKRKWKDSKVLFPHVNVKGILSGYVQNAKGQDNPKNAFAFETLQSMNHRLHCIQNQFGGDKKSVLPLDKNTFFIF